MVVIVVKLELNEEEEAPSLHESSSQIATEICRSKRNFERNLAKNIDTMAKSHFMLTCGVVPEINL